MVVGVCRIEILIEEAFSLKDKRQILRSIIQRLKDKFNASVAETGFQDIWQRAEIGIACISNETSLVDSMMASMVNFVEYDGRVVMADYSTEIIHMG